VTEALTDQGVETLVQPEKSFVMKRLTNVLTLALSTR
jgi:hypothetical protein